MQHGFSTVDGFMEVNEGLAEMIKYAANEPSVGLYYIQQHTQNAVPNLLHLKSVWVNNSVAKLLQARYYNCRRAIKGFLCESHYGMDDVVYRTLLYKKLTFLPLYILTASAFWLLGCHPQDKVVSKSHEVVLHTEDLEDSITMVKSMKDCGISISDGMIKDIRKSLILTSTSQPQRGLIHNQSSGFQIGRSSSWGPTAFGRNITQQDGTSSATYLSTVLKSARQKAVSIRWPQLDAKQSNSKLPTNQPPPDTAANTISTLSNKEAEELPLSSEIVEEPPDETMPLDGDPPAHDLSAVKENYEAFRAVREAKLEKWLEE